MDLALILLCLCQVVSNSIHGAGSRLQEQIPPNILMSSKTAPLIIVCNAENRMVMVKMPHISRFSAGTFSEITILSQRVIANNHFLVVSNICYQKRSLLQLSAMDAQNRLPCRWKLLPQVFLGIVCGKKKKAEHIPVFWAPRIF